MAFVIEFLMLTAVGVALIILGINNRKGNINSIHSYHRQRVSEENKAAFGKLMGTGSIVCGTGIAVCGVLTLLAEVTGTPLLATIGSCLVFAGLFIGIGCMTYATIKYNKGIF